MELKKQQQCEESFNEWFGGGLKRYLEDSRSRYRMEVKDREKREKLHLSNLPSVKSLSVVDNCTDRALQEYHLDPNAIAYIAAAPGNLDLEQKCRWLSEIVRVRSEKPYFPFYLWNQKSIKAGFADGMEACLVSWVHRKKTKKGKEYLYTDPNGVQVPVDQAMYEQWNLIQPGFEVRDKKEEVVVKDTWWIDQLMPGKDICWDPKAQLFDVNLGSFCLVKLHKPMSWILDNVELGVFDKITEKELKTYQESGPGTHSDTKTVATNPENIDFGDFNDIEVWLFFDIEDNDWGVQFSLQGKKELSKRKPVNDVFFNGREVNCLPVVIGYNDPELWENVGRSIPKIIAPLEDEATDHRNNYNDWAKQLLRGKYWKSEDSDVDIEQLVNMPVVNGVYGQDFGRIDLPQGSLEVLRATDSIDGEMNAVVPVDINGMGRRVVQKGQNATLGNLQMSQGQMDSKLGVRLMTRNKTFFGQVLYLIAQMEMAWETDETVARLAAAKVSAQPQANGQPMPQYQPPMDGTVVDFRQLDFPFQVKINAGLGSIPLSQKGQALVQIADFRKANGVPTDFNEIARQVNVVAGYDADSFTPTQPPPGPKPPVDYKCSVTVDLNQLLQLAPEAGQFLLDKMISGGASVDVKIKENTNAEAQQNGGGLMTPNRTGERVDATGEAAMGMSQGGQHSPQEGAGQ